MKIEKGRGRRNVNLPKEAIVGAVGWYLTSSMKPMNRRDATEKKISKKKIERSNVQTAFARSCTGENLVKERFIDLNKQGRL